MPEKTSRLPITGQVREYRVGWRDGTKAIIRAKSDVQAATIAERKFGTVPDYCGPK